MDRGVCLSFNALSDSCSAVADAALLNFAPRILGHPDLVATDSFADVGDIDRFRPRELRDRIQIDKQQAFSRVNEGVGSGREFLNKFAIGARQATDERARYGAPCHAIGRREGNVAQPRIVDEQPIGKIAFFLDDPDDRVESRCAIWPDGTGGCRLASDKRACEELLFGGEQRIAANDQPRREIDDKRNGRAIARRDAIDRLRKQVGARDGAPIDRREAETRKQAWVTG
ncbi:hypothetical protein [Sphingopyxis sp. GW247-27LB]|uniref:hypothetical protein n=1 Tax=Sphingopyxis sp. GW247-27LB TaxID=2012632 RepID=UPI001C3F10FF|nr:hypothetical protein [Sphingopyxis sp. GW247-27LB]